MKLVIALITCDREDKTEETLRNFVKHNGWCATAPCDVHCIHGDDGSISSKNVELAASFGFDTIIANSPTKQLGAHAMRRAMIDAAVEHYSPTHIFVLENDWKCERPIPWAAITQAFKRDDVYAFRLYGVHKQKDKTRPTGAEHAGRGKCDPKWEKIELAGEVCEIGDIHWGAPPCIVRTEELQFLHTGTSSDSKSMRKSGQIERRTVRVVDNVFWHIGYQRTPRFRK